MRTVKSPSVTLKGSQGWGPLAQALHEGGVLLTQCSRLLGI